jgi:hypothetical protein
MKNNLGLATMAVLSCGLLFSTVASASVMGSLALDGGGVTVSATNLVWVGFATVNGIATNLTYGAGTPVTNGTDVTLQNLPGSLPGTPINDFMTFAGIASLDFTLDVVGPGSSNTNCSAAGLLANDGECSAFPGSPLILSQATNGTVVDLGVSGTASDGTSPISMWNGEFSETITTLGNISDPTPLQIQQYFITNGAPNSNTISSTYSGTFTATIESAVPEPSSLTMMLMGSVLILFAVSRRPKHFRS